jgi:hypothetical protein
MHPTTGERVADDPDLARTRPLTRRFVRRVHRLELRELLARRSVHPVHVGAATDHPVIETALEVGLPGRSDHRVSRLAPEPFQSGPVRGLLRWFDHHVIRERLSALEARGARRSATRSETAGARTLPRAIQWVHETAGKLPLPAVAFTTE